MDNKTDPRIFIGCYVKRFYIPAKKENMYKILDARGDCNTGDFLYDDGEWRDIEDSTVITNDVDLKSDGEYPWCLFVGDKEYTGDNPYTNDMNEFRLTIEEIKTRLKVGDRITTEEYLCEVIEIGGEVITVNNGFDTIEISYEDVLFFG